MRTVQAALFTVVKRWDCRQVSDKQSVDRPQEAQYSLANEMSADTHYDTREPREHHARGEKPDTKAHPSDGLSVWIAQDRRPQGRNADRTLTGMDVGAEG